MTTGTSVPITCPVAPLSDVGLYTNGRLLCTSVASFNSVYTHSGCLHAMCLHAYLLFFFFFNDTPTTEIYTLSLHYALLFFFKEHASHLHSHSSLTRRLPL